MSDNNNPVASHTPFVRKNDYILLLAENISLADIQMGGVIFIIVYTLIYISLIIWAQYKDKKKQAFSTKAFPIYSHSVSHPNLPRRNFRAMHIDITSDTLDFTNQSVRMNFEEQKDISAILHQSGVDGFSGISPLNRGNSANVSPINKGKPSKFNLMRTPPRSLSHVELEENNTMSNTHPRTTVNDEEIFTVKDEPQTISTKQDTINFKDEIILSNPNNNINDDLPKDDELLYKTEYSKRVPKKVAKENFVQNLPIKVASPKSSRQSFKSKYIKLLGQRHVIFSTIERMSRISPRYKRITLIFFLLNCNFFAISISFINSSIFEGNSLLEILKVSSFSWIVFIAITWLSSVSKEALKFTKTNDEFLKTLSTLEKEAKYKTVGVHIILAMVFPICLAQYALFISLKSEAIVSWIACSVFAFIIQMVFFDALWLSGIALVYVKAYDSQHLRKLYRILNSVRFWKV